MSPPARRDFVHDLVPLLVASREHPHAIVLAHPQPPIGAIVELAAASAPDVVRRFEVIGQGRLASPAGSIGCALLVPAP